MRILAAVATTSPRRSRAHTRSTARRSTSAAASTTARSRRDAVVRLPLATTNRHGLIAGATGTGKTKTVQVLAEQLSAAGVSVFAADYKGDLSGLLEPAPADGPAAARMEDLGPAVRAVPASRWSSCRWAGSGPASRSARTVTDFGPQLLAKVLGANETQEASLALVYRFADEHGLPARRPRRPARAADVLRDRRGQGRPEGDRRRLEPDDRRAPALARRRSRTAAAASSSASRSSRSRTCSGSTRAAAGSSRASSCRRCRTSRSSSRPS